jgi:hypothetical protein
VRAVRNLLAPKIESVGTDRASNAEDRSARVVDQGATGTERNLRLATNVRHWGMRTADQILSPAAREALACRQAARASTLIDQLAEQAQGRDDIRTECAGVIAGSWFGKSARRGEDLSAAGLLMLTGHVDLDQLDHWVRVGWERRR